MKLQSSVFIAAVAAAWCCATSNPDVQCIVVLIVQYIKTNNYVWTNECESEGTQRRLDRLRF